MNETTEKIFSVLFSAIASGGVSYIIAGLRARVVSAEQAGRYKADFEHLKRTVDVQNEVIHERVSKISEGMSATLDKLDARTIVILENHAELRGMLLSKKEN